MIIILYIFVFINLFRFWVEFAFPDLYFHSWESGMS